jgi:hypothetical protein
MMMRYRKDSSVSLTCARKELIKMALTYIKYTTVCFFRLPEKGCEGDA